MLDPAHESTISNGCTDSEPDSLDKSTRSTGAGHIETSAVIRLSKHYLAHVVLSTEWQHSQIII